MTPLSISTAADNVTTPINALATPTGRSLISTDPIARPSTTGTVLEATASNVNANTTPYSVSTGVNAELSTSAPSSTSMQIASHGHQVHEASSINASSFATGLSSSAPSTHPHFHSHPHPSTPAVPINHSNNSSSAANSTPNYTDDLSFHTSSYGSYDTSFSSNSSGSPWTPGMSGSPHHSIVPPPFYHHQAYYDMYPTGKQLEPILQPGEMPAPRPPMSYAALIGEALLLAPPPHHLYVSEISESIKKRYACESPGLQQV